MSGSVIKKSSHIGRKDLETTARRYLEAMGCRHIRISVSLAGGSARASGRMKHGGERRFTFTVRHGLLKDSLIVKGEGGGLLDFIDEIELLEAAIED